MTFGITIRPLRISAIFQTSSSEDIVPTNAQNDEQQLVQLHDAGTYEIFRSTFSVVGPSQDGGESEQRQGNRDQRPADHRNLSEYLKCQHGISVGESRCHIRICQN